jgi:hypothetical protein
LAAAVKQEPGVEVELVNGKMGELTVLVDGKVAAKKRFIFKPSAQKVLSAVREAPAKAS